MGDHALAERLGHDRNPIFGRVLAANSLISQDGAKGGEVVGRSFGPGLHCPSFSSPETPGNGRSPTSLRPIQGGWGSSTRSPVLAGVRWTSARRSASASTTTRTETKIDPAAEQPVTKESLEEIARQEAHDAPELLVMPRSLARGGSQRLGNKADMAHQ